MLFWLLAVPGAVLAAGILYQTFGAWRDRRRFPPPGSLIEASPGLTLHLRTRGSGPPVWLEAGVAATSASWKLVEDSLANDCTVYSYDRAGLGWSPPATTAREIPAIIGELHSLVLASGVERPLPFVGHSFGGLILRHYAARYPEDVSALVLLDPLEPVEWWPLRPIQKTRLAKGVMLSRRGCLLAKLGVVRLALDILMSGSQLLPKIIARISSGKGSAVPDRLVGEIRKLPREVWPVVKTHWCNPRSFQTMADYLERLPHNCSLSLEDSALRNIPVIVLTAGNSPREVRESHRRLAEASRGGRQIVLDDSGHWVQLDAPQTVHQYVTSLLQRHLN